MLEQSRIWERASDTDARSTWNESWASERKALETTGRGHEENGWIREESIRTCARTCRSEERQSRKYRTRDLDKLRGEEKFERNNVEVEWAMVAEWAKIAVRALTLPRRSVNKFQCRSQLTCTACAANETTAQPFCIQGKVRISIYTYIQIYSFCWGGSRLLEEVEEVSTSY